MDDKITKGNNEAQPKARRGRQNATILFCLILYVKRERKLVIYFLVLIHFQERFQIDAFSMKTLSVLVCMVWAEG